MTVLHNFVEIDLLILTNSEMSKWAEAISEQSLILEV